MRAFSRAVCKAFTIQMCMTIPLLLFLVHSYPIYWIAPIVTITFLYMQMKRNPSNLHVWALCVALPLSALCAYLWETLLQIMRHRNDLLGMMLSRRYAWHFYEDVIQGYFIPATILTFLLAVGIGAIANKQSKAAYFAKTMLIQLFLCVIFAYFVPIALQQQSGITVYLGAAYLPYAHCCIWLAALSTAGYLFLQHRKYREKSCSLGVPLAFAFLPIALVFCTKSQYIITQSVAVLYSIPFCVLTTLLWARERHKNIKQKPN